jgi:uncharacterized protein YndB with AHSA1/START domain
MENYDWSKFTQRIPINAPIQEIYNCWTTQKGIEKWFLRLGEFSNSEQLLKDSNTAIQKNDTYRWMWHGHPDEVVESGKILEANDYDLLQFTFAEQCVVTENIPTDELSKTNFHLGCSCGWNFYLANLKSILEGGIDLRNKNIAITKVINS